MVIRPDRLVLFSVFSAVDSYYTNSGDNARLLTNNWAIAYNSGMVTEFNEVQAHLREEQVFATVPGDVIVVEFSATNEQLLSRSEIVELLDAVIVFPVPDEPRISIYRRLLNLL